MPKKSTPKTRPVKTQPASATLPCPNPRSIALSFIALVMLGHVLVLGRTIVIPFIIALFFWFLINALARFYKKFITAPQWLRLILAAVTCIGVLMIPVELISNNVPQVLELAPKYQENLQKMVNLLLSRFHINQDTVINSIIAELDIGVITKAVAGAFTDLAGNVVLTTVYLAFLLMEQGSFDNKIRNMVSSPARHENILKICSNLTRKIQDYLWIKTIMSMATALLSYALMLYVGLDFAAFWAVLIFMLNFIPNVGAIIATVFPATIALVQFDTLTPFIIITCGITVIQFCIGLVEPVLLSDSLNLSGLVILLSLVIWGSIWGIAGMFLCVPIMMMLKIILEEIPSTRPWAVALSQNGVITK